MALNTFKCNYLTQLHSKESMDIYMTSRRGVLISRNNDRH